MRIAWSLTSVSPSSSSQAEWKYSSVARIDCVHLCLRVLFVDHGRHCRSRGGVGELRMGLGMFEWRRGEVPNCRPDQLAELPNRGELDQKCPGGLYVERHEAGKVESIRPTRHIDGSCVVDG
jgi:hypothetical protein